MLRFGLKDFLRIYTEYNNFIWPMPMIGYALGLIVILSLCYQNRLADRMISLVLGFFWAWIGVFNQIKFVSRIDSWATVFGFLFILQSIMIMYHGVIRNRLNYRILFDAYSFFAWIFVIYALVVYPLWGFFIGRTYPSAAVFGISAGPTAIFTFGMYLFTIRKFPTILLIIPLLWSLMAFGTRMILGIYEDFFLFVAGLSTTVILILRNRYVKSSYWAMYL